MDKFVKGGETLNLRLPNLIETASTIQRQRRETYQCMEEDTNFQNSSNSGKTE